MSYSTNIPFQPFSDSPTGGLHSISTSYSNHEHIKVTYPTILNNSVAFITTSQKPQQYATTTTFFGLLTFIYLLTILSIYGFSGFIFNVGLGPTAETLNSFGILNSSMIVYNGEWWRLLTSVFLSSSLLHAVINFFILFKICGDNEKKIGSTLTMSIMIISSVGGNCIGAFLSPNQISCSTSVPVCGLLGPMVVQSSLSRYREHVIYQREIGENWCCYSVFSLNLSFFFIVLWCIFDPFQSIACILFGFIIGGICSLFFFSSFAIPFRRNDVDLFPFDSEIKHNHSFSGQRALPHYLKLVSILFITSTITLSVLLLKFEAAPDINLLDPKLTGCAFMSKIMTVQDNENDNSNDVCSSLCVPGVGRLYASYAAEMEIGTCANVFGYGCYQHETEVYIEGYAFQVDIFTMEVGGECT